MTLPSRSVAVLTGDLVASRRVEPVHIDYCGFLAPDVFLVGYGLGPNHGEHTNRPDLCVMDEA